MKEAYKIPEVEVIKFACEDIITTSGNNEELPDPELPGGGIHPGLPDGPSI